MAEPRSGGSFHFVREIPKPPAAYVAHPYTLLSPGDLVGRQAELDRLTEWGARPGAELHCARVLCLVAIGGMGKSALSWKWFDEIAGQVMAPLAGRLWWSFYESDAGYENFLTRVLAYLRGVPRAEVQRLQLAEREVELLERLDGEPFLVVLDGLERLLLAYARPDAARLREDGLDETTGDSIAASGEAPAPGRVRRRLRRAADPRAGNFLRKLARVRASRVLITSRLFPAELETDAGAALPAVEALALAGLDADDACELWRVFGAGGARAEVRRLCLALDRHPLLIRALAGSVARFRRAPGDLDAWRQDHPNFDPAALPTARRESHVLEFALSGIHRDARQVLVTLAGFRMPATRDHLAALLVGAGRAFPSVARLDAALADLEARGLMGRDRRAKRYDLHPVVRGVTWRGMGRIGQRIVCQNLEALLAAMPAPRRQARSLDELTAALELYHTLAGLEHYDQAYEIFKRHLFDPMCLRLSLCAQAAEILELLFPAGIDASPALASRDQCLSATWNLSYCYSFSGRVALAAKLVRRILIAPASPWLNAIRRSRAWYNFAVSCRGSLRESELAARRSILLARKIGALELGSKLAWLAELLSLRGRTEDASSVFEAAAASPFETDEGHDVSCFAAFTEHALRLGEIDRAAELAESARKLAASKRALGRPAISAANARCAVLAARGDLEAALEQAHVALMRARSMSFCTAEMKSLLLHARLHLERQDPDAARDFLEDLWELAERGPYPWFRAHGLNLLARVEIRCENRAAAAEAAREAYCLAWCDGPPFADSHQLSAARKTLDALGVTEPRDLPYHEASKHPSMPAVKIGKRTL